MSHSIDKMLTDRPRSAFIDRRTVEGADKLRQQVCNPNWFIDTGRSGDSLEKLKQSLKMSPDQTFFIHNDGNLPDHFVCYVYDSGMIRSIYFQIREGRINFDLSKLKVENSLLFQVKVEKKTGDATAQVFVNLRNQICNEKWFFPKRIPVIEHVRDLRDTSNSPEFLDVPGNRKPGTFTVQQGKENSFTVIVSREDSVITKVISIARGKIWLDGFPYSSFHEIQKELGLFHPHVMSYSNYMKKNVENPKWFAKDINHITDHLIRLQFIPGWFYVEVSDDEDYKLSYLKDRTLQTIPFILTDMGVEAKGIVYPTFDAFLASIDLNTKLIERHSIKNEVENPIWFSKRGILGNHLEKLASDLNCFFIHLKDSGLYQVTFRNKNEVFSLNMILFAIQPGPKIVCQDGTSFTTFYSFLQSLNLNLDEHSLLGRRDTLIDDSKMDVDG